MLMIFLAYILILNVIKLTESRGESIPQCNMILGETIPTNLTYDNKAPFVNPISKLWQVLISNSKKNIRIASFYWTMLNRDVSNTTQFPSSRKGSEILDMLIEKSKLIPLEIVQNGTEELYDLGLLKKNKLVKIHYIDVPRFENRGVQHSKVLISDNSSAFIGSANMDWRSLTEIKELGVLISECEEIVHDVNKFWEVLRLLSGPTGQIPKQWPSYLSPKYNHTNPFIANVNGVHAKIYTATSPPDFNPPHRTDDLTALLQTINKSKKFIYISVMDFNPLDISYSHNRPTIYWPDIENQLKIAAIDRGVTVRLLISLWPHTSKKMVIFLKSLEILSKVWNVRLSVKLFIVPAFEKYQQEISYSRVSHSKYMVTDNSAYIGTSNWSGDYFKYSGGISLNYEEIEPNSHNSLSIRSALEDIFNTDWNSVYAHDL